MRKTVLMFSLALAAGCASAPGYRAPEVQVPTAFRELRDTTIQISAVAPDTAESLKWPELGDTTLTQLINQLTRANLDVQAAEARVRGARAARTEVAFDLAPTVTVGGGYTRQRLASAPFRRCRRVSRPEHLGRGFDASWELDLFGRVRHNVQAQGAFLEATQENLRDRSDLPHRRAGAGVLRSAGSAGAIAVAARNAENQRRTFGLTRERLEAGRGTAFDTERAQAQLSTTLATIPDLESRVRQAQYQIGVLVGASRRGCGGAGEAAPLPDFPDLPASLRRTRSSAGARMWLPRNARLRWSERWWGLLRRITSRASALVAVPGTPRAS